MKKKLTDKQKLRLDKRKWKKIIIKRTRFEKKRKYKEWADSVKERDGWCDVISGKSYINKKSSLQAAHILSKENYPELMYDIDNGLSLAFHNHKNSPISSHLDGFVFTLWVMAYRPKQYEYLSNYIKTHDCITSKQVLEHV